MDFTKLVEKAMKKDKEAMEELFNLTSQKGYFVAIKYLKSKEDAQDIVQDAYLSALTKLDQLKEPAKFDKWLYQIISNKAKNYLVKNKPILFEQLESDDENATAFEEGLGDDRVEFQPKENFDYSELKLAMKELIDELPDDQRMCVLMYYFEELSINEIADALELNNNTIKSRLNYARTKIKDKIDDLEKKGIRIFGIAPIPFILWMLRQEEQAATIKLVSTEIIKQEVLKSLGKEATKKTITIMGKTISTKLIITVTTISIAVVSCAVYYNYSAEESRKKEIYDSLKIEFSDNKIFEYGMPFEQEQLVMDYVGDISLKNNVDTKKVGNQTLYYVVSKEGIEKKINVDIEIKDTKIPIINLTTESVTLTVGDTFDPNQYVKDAYDEIDGDLKEGIKMDNPVDMTKAGDYNVTYTVVDNHELSVSKVLTVSVKEEVVEVVESNPVPVPPIPETTVKTIALDKLGRTIEIPKELNASDPVYNENMQSTHYEYTSNDPKFGGEGLAVDIHYIPYSVENSMSQSGMYLFKTKDEYVEKGFEIVDKGSYFTAIGRGYDGAVMGSAWVMPYEIDAMKMRVQGEGRNEYVITVRTNTPDKGIYLGFDGFEDKRVEIARQIFDSIK